MNDAFIKMMKDSVSNQVRSEAEERGQLTLGMLKTELNKCHSDKPVVFDIGGYPFDTTSYRGYYDQLAIEPGEDQSSVKETIKLLEEAIGKEFTGYKGGTFRMNDYTMIWCSEYGTASGNAIIGIEEKEDKVIVLTQNTYNE